MGALFYFASPPCTPGWVVLSLRPFFFPERARFLHRLSISLEIQGWHYCNLSYMAEKNSITGPLRAGRNLRMPWGAEGRSTLTWPVLTRCLCLTRHTRHFYK